MADSELTEVISFDGQHVWLNKTTALYEVGNFLGGGAAGTVYEAEHVNSKEHFALKILTPLGYKLLSPALLRRCNVIAKGKAVPDMVEQGLEPFLKEHLWWLMNGSTKQYLAAYYSEKNGTLREMSLKQCMSIWGPQPEGVTDEDDGKVDVMQTPGGSRVVVPSVPPKYVDFVRRRSRIFREIYNMRKISNHRNVIRLKDVLELTQESKCTIFLVMELANGGELFDRIKIDCGTREETAVLFFKQLLDGVQHCHEMGVCHRDLKPENLLLQDAPGKPTTLKIADFGFSAWVAMAISDDNWDGNAPQRLPEVQQQLYAAGTPPVSLVMGSVVQNTLTNSSPLRVLNSVVGSPFYVAPEVLQARGYDGYKADVWSLGVILYAMLAGNLPFSQELASCKRFRAYCRWVREMTSKGIRFYDNSTVEYPEWLFHAKFSPDSKSLIVSMLHPDPTERISVLEASYHPWCLRGIKAIPRASQHQCSLSRYHESLNNGANIVQPVVMNNQRDQIHNVVETMTGESSASLVPIDDEVEVVNDEVMEECNEDVASDDDIQKDDDGDIMQIDDGDGDEGIFQMDDEATSSQTPTKIVLNSITGPVAARRLPQTLFSERIHSPPIPENVPARVSNSGGRAPFHSIPVAMHGGHDGIRSTTDDAVSKPRVASPLLSQSAPVTWGSPLPPQFSWHQLVNESRPADLFTEIVEEEERPNVTPSFAMLRSRAPSFHDKVKKSTRFVTSVAALEVFGKFEEVLKHCKQGTLTSPAGIISKVTISYDSYMLEVWGTETSGPLCSIRLYSLNQSTVLSLGISAASVADGAPIISPSAETVAPTMASPLSGYYLVEFVRGTLEIFAFKRFYDWLRQHVKELVKREYSYTSLEFGSPVRVTNLSQQAIGEAGRHMN